MTNPPSSDRSGFRHVRPAKVPRGEDSSFAALLTGVIELPGFEGESRWLYSWVEAAWSRFLKQWFPLTGGRSSTDAGDPFAFPAANGFENANDGFGVGDGIELLGVDTSQEPLASSGFRIIEIKNLPAVVMRPITLQPEVDPPPGPQPAFWFTATNMLDGTCDPPPLAASSSSASDGGIVVGPASGLNLSPAGILSNHHGPGLFVDAANRNTIRIGPGLGFDPFGALVVVGRQGFEFIDTAGGLLVEGTSTVLPLDLDRLAPVIGSADDDQVTLDTNEITLEVDGVVALSPTVALQSYGAGVWEVEVEAEIDRDDGLGYIPVLGSRMYLGNQE